MLKRLSVALAALFAFVQLATAAGTIGLSLSQQFDSLGKPLNGGRLYFFQAGTTTPQSAYQDSGLTIPHPNPIVLDSAGRIPQFFLADGSIKIRLDNAAGVTQIAADGVLVIGPSSGGGGGSPVDPTTIIATGDLKARYGVGALSGFVRANGRTIGSATSGATERANADCQALFQYLWDTDANLAVSGGRGASAAADWSANKTIALPDWRGRALAFLDDMGNSAAGRLTAAYFGTAATALGAAGGTQSHALIQAELAQHAHSFAGTTGTESQSHTHAYSNALGAGNGAQAGGDFTAARFVTNNTTTGTESTTHTHSFSGTTGTTGSGQAFSIVQPTMLATIYLKL